MRCEQAQQLFDAYLDGELSASLSTELGVHRLRCAECRQALALLEVSGHIVRTDREPVQLHRNFTERLLACMGPRPVRWSRRLRRGLYLAGPLAAAAVIALVFLGVFDHRDTKVAGEKEIRIERMGVGMEQPQSRERAEAEHAQGDRDQRLLQEWIERARDNLVIKRESGESLRQFLDLTLLQWADIVESAKDGATDEEHFPGAEQPVTAPDTVSPSRKNADEP